MRATLPLIALLLAPLCAPAYAQQPAPASNGEDSITHITPTPEMWFYEQEWRRHDDPRQAVRMKAEFKAAQRQRRLAALQWFGYSNSRPIANSVPLYGQYSPAWIGNGYEPYQWLGVYGGPRLYTARRPAYGLW
ncbi:MAG: hypothetical protein K6T86_11245 [Pirellulales bacterium]|nr:hypothetical protein [Pirellulales bacterium]